MKQVTDNPLLKHLMQAFRITPEQLNASLDFYRNNFQGYDNEIYSRIDTRLVHLATFLDRRDWFGKRFDLVFKQFPDKDYEVQPDEMIDIGFSLPYLPIRWNEENSHRLFPEYVLVDKFESAGIVSEEILKYINDKWRHRSTKAKIIIGDLHDDATIDAIVSKSKGARKLLVGIEAVEHLENPNKFWELADELGNPNAIVSLPTGPKIPSHHMTFDTIEAARKYLQQHMTISEEEIVAPPGKWKEGDAFPCLVAHGRTQLSRPVKIYNIHKPYK